MGIRFGYNAGTKTTTASSAATYVFNASEIPGTGVASYSLVLTGTNHNLGNATRIRIKASGQTIWDVDSVHYRSMIQRMSRANYSPATSDTNLELPLYVLDGKGDERYAAGFPNGQAPSVEWVINSTPAAGTVGIGWSQSDKPFQFWTSFLGSQTNVAASVTNGRVPITQGGLVRGFGLNSTGLDRVKLVLGGKEIFNLSGTHFLAAQKAENLTTLTNPLFVKLHDPTPAPIGTSYLEIDTGSGWAGTANELSVLAIHPQAV